MQGLLSVCDTKEQATKDLLSLQRSVNCRVVPGVTNICSSCDLSVGEDEESTVPSQDSSLQGTYEQGIDFFVSSTNPPVVTQMEILFSEVKGKFLFNKVDFNISKYQF